MGSHLARQLLAQHYRVRALVRPGSTLAILQNLFLDVVEGDICHAADVLEAARGCQGIIHAAALAQVNPARDPAIWAVNLTGTENVVLAARHHQVRRLVYVGTANVFGFGTKSHPGNEETPFAGYRYGLDYMDSKRAATNLICQAAREHNLPAVLVHPSFLVGPLDAKPTSGAMLLAVARKQVPGYAAGGKNFIHVQDAAIATVNALTMGRVGHSYILGHENLTYREAFGLMASVAGVSAPGLAIPPGVLRAYGSLSEWWATRTGHPARLTRPLADVANDGHYFSAQKAINELALPQTPVREAVREAFEWFTKNGYLQ